MAWTATHPLARRSFGASLPLLVGASAFLLTLVNGSNCLGDPDIFWHIVTGRWIVAHGAVPHADLFSFTMPDAPWVAHEWAADVVAAAAFAALGWPGLVIMTAMATGAAMALLARTLLRHLEPLHAFIATAGAWILLLPHWLARPHILALPLLVLWISALVWARGKGKAPNIGWALLIVPWVNLHGTFLVGLGFAGFFAIEAVIAERNAAAQRAAAVAWGRFLLAAFAASLVTPNGIEAYLLPYHLLQMKYALAILVEWQSPDFQKLQPLELWLIGALAVALWSGLRLPGTRLAMVLLLVHMALAHGRHGELLGFIAPLIAAPVVVAQFPRRGAIPAPAAAPATVVAFAVMAAASAATAALPIAPDPRETPSAAVQAVLDHHVPGPVLNEQSFGGYLIFAGVPTFIDGRSDMFGDAFMKRHFQAARALSGELPEMLKEYHIGWTLFPPESQAVVILDLLPGWRRLYSDEVAVVHVPRDPG